MAAAVLMGCGENVQQESTNTIPDFDGVYLQGEAQGTTYNIKYTGTAEDFKAEVDSILDAFDYYLSTWREGSVINQINAHSRRDTVFAFNDEHKYFSVVFDLSREISQKTNGAFNPSVYSLVQAWGFGLSNREEITPELIDSLVADVGFSEFDIDMIEVYENEYFYKETNIWKGNPDVKLDFNAIAQGYSVDLLAEFLQEKGIENFMVELGGEVFAQGVNHIGNPWSIAIDKPLEESAEREFQAILPLNNHAVATSGNYRKFYEVDGKKYAHTIDPRTGYPVQHNLLSATVVASDCATADAYATAFMVMGIEGTIEFLNLYPDLGLELYLIFEENGELQTITTENLANSLQQL